MTISTKRVLFIFPLFAAAVSCVVQAGPGAAERLNNMVEDYWEAYLELNPIKATLFGDNRFNDRLGNTISEEYRARTKALDMEYLSKLASIDPSQLDGQDALSYEVFKRNRELSLEDLRFKSHYLPVSQFFSMPSFFAQMGSGKSIQPFHTVKDYENFLARAEGFPAWVDTAITNMKKGVKEGIVQPKVVIEKTIPQLAAHVVDDPTQSVFYQPVTNFPAAFDEVGRKRLTGAYRLLITNTIVPAYRRLHDYMAGEYLSHGRTTVGLMHLPNGKAWYDHLVHTRTTTGLSGEEIHAIGLKEVERITREMEAVKDRIGFRGDLKAFFEHLRSDDRYYYSEAKDILAEYETLKQHVAKALPKVFGVLPKADYEIRPIEEFRAKSAATAQYNSPTPDGKRLGVFYVNTYDLKARPKYSMQALSLHEANPGHHLQISIQFEVDSLPRFRRFGSFTAYTEGWGLYAESLGKELGLYQDPYQYFGMLNLEIWRAVRLVVDTGIHAKGWTRDQALDYMLAHTSLAETDTIAEIERYIVIPGQALAYKIGQLKFAELRARAEKRLGDKFDIRTFHDALLVDGALPLDVLERKMDAWLESKA